VDEDEVVRLRRAIGRLTRQLNTSATDEGLTPTQASVLGLVVGRGPVALPELVRLEHINPTMLSRVIGKLDELELITRTPDPDDLRSARLSATRSGRDLHERIKEQRAQVVSQGADRLDPQEHAALVAGLSALERLAQELQAE
jgi:DNA-binding MarR family transcriptional regulator